jgi:hypothetical protein
VYLQRTLATFAALLIVFLVAVSSVAFLGSSSIKPSLGHSGPVSNPDETFYVGVTYCGSSIAEAKQLIDHVKNYTNLFVLQSGALMFNDDAMEEIGDYAVKSGLNLMLYVGGASNQLATLGSERWGSSFLGLYCMDEPGGKVIDKSTQSIGSQWRRTDGSVTAYFSVNDTDSGDITFYPSGEIKVNEELMANTTTRLSENADNNPLTEHIIWPGTFFRTYAAFSSTTYYYTNGTITYATESCNETGYVLASQFYTYQPDGSVQDFDGNIVTDQGSITRFTPYDKLLDRNPLGTYSKTADIFTSGTVSGITSYRNQSCVKLFTSDYALYWFDYKAGYDTVFAEFVGNESRERHIALCRGAAETLGDEWGAMITWKYSQAPYLESGDELYNDLVLAYSSGAKYGIVFTYPNLTAYGTLTDEHFEALERFWTELHTDPASLGNTESNVAYIIPADYGFGFRSANDTIWGQFPADELSTKIYSDTTALTAKYGAKLNILYDGVETAAKLGGYSTVYYYNQTVT